MMVSRFLACTALAMTFAGTAFAQEAPPPPGTAAPMSGNNAMASGPMSAPMDQVISDGGVQTVCTGVGSAKDNPQFQGWPAQIEFSNEGTQYLSGVHIVLSQNGHVLRDTVCNGPWFLVKGDGMYQVKGSFQGMRDKTQSFSASGAHKRVVLQFAKAPNQ